MKLRGWLTRDEVRERTGLSDAAITALARSGALHADAATGNITQASVEHYEKAQLIGAYQFGLLAQAAAQGAITKNYRPLERLLSAAPTGVSSERAGPEGGFAVPSTLGGAEILAPLLSDTAFTLPAKCDRQITPTNSYIRVVDRKPPWTAGGVQAHLVDENEPIPQSKLALESLAQRLKKVSVLCPVSEELLEDAAALGAHLLRAMSEAIVYRASELILFGDGAGEFLGFMRAPCLITVPPEAGQAAASIVAQNVAKMFAAMATNGLATSLWLVHPDALGRIIALGVGFFSPGDEQAPVGRLLGRPLMPLEQCEALGSVGDIALIDPMAYSLPIKQPAILPLTSLHLWFDRQLVAFKATLRADGQPSWAQPVPSRVGGGLRSPFVTLGARP